MAENKFLDKINSPADVKKLSVPQLEQLAKEIRQLLISVISHTGGHLAPNLGVVELTLALHKVFNTPEDKIIFDVGHQAYIHKIITGRREQFPTLRQYGGLSGFPKRSESEHDAFGTGHSSTSISAALGMACARDLQGEDYNVVAVIGDGSMTGGMAFEALNNAGMLHKNMIVVLNDNEMSISKNVGAMSEYLYQLRTGETYNKIKNDIEGWLKNMEFGSDVLKAIRRLKGSVKYLMVPTSIFEELGFTYLGPVDGHDLDGLLDVLQAAKKIDGPVMVHVLTKKGKGYKPAEESPNKFHGTGPFDIATGKKIINPNAPVSYTEVFGKTLTKLADTDDKIVGITAAMPDGTGLNIFAEAHKDHFFDVGIAEQHAVTAAAGMAAAGMKPVAAIYSTFMQRAYDSIMHDICMQKLHVTLCLDRAGLVGDDGYTHHGVFDYAYLRSIPNMTIMAPKDENERCRKAHNLLVAVSKLRNRLAKHLSIAYRCSRIGNLLACRNLEGTGAMELVRTLFCRLIALAFFCQHMHHNRSVNLLRCLQYFNQAVNIMTVNRTEIGEAQLFKNRGRHHKVLHAALQTTDSLQHICAKLHVFQPALNIIFNLIIGLASTQVIQIIAHCTDVFGNRHFVVIQYNDHLLM